MSPPLRKRPVRTNDIERGRSSDWSAWTSESSLPASGLFRPPPWIALASAAQPPLCQSDPPSLWSHPHSSPHSSALACRVILVHTPVYSLTVSFPSDVSCVSTETVSVLIYPQHRA